jgi:hypothetical protein
MKNTKRAFEVVVSAAILLALGTQAWAGPIGPRRDTSAAARTSSSLMAREGAGAPQVARDQNAQLKVYGKTYGEWAAEWVRWSEAGPADENAITDTSGEFCAANQPKKDVWFLAGTFGGLVERTCTIPKDRALFYPLFESPWIDCPGTPDEDLSDAQVRFIVAGQIDAACQLTSTLDGVAISSLRVLIVRAQSRRFRTVLPDNPAIAGVCDPPLVGGKTGRRIVDGYWVMLPPLSPGKHTLTLHGAMCAFPDPEDKSVPPDPQRGRIIFENGVTYHLHSR